MTAREAREKLYCHMKQAFLNDFFLLNAKEIDHKEWGWVSKGHLKPHSTKPWTLYCGKQDFNGKGDRLDQL